MWGQDKFGNLRPINANQRVKLNYESNCVRFTLQRNETYRPEGLFAVYIIGDFNNWQKQEHFRLKLTIDPNNGMVKLMNQFHFSPPLLPGTYEYSFVLVDIEGNETILSDNGSKFQAFSFEWLTSKHNLMIKTSEDKLTPGFSLDMIAIKTLHSNRQAVIPVEWSITPADPAIKIVGNQIFIDAKYNSSSTITLRATDPENGSYAERSLPVIQNSNRQGKLVHYIRSDNLYKGDKFLWDLWTFEEDNGSQAIQLSGNSDFGAIALVQNKNVIVRKQIWDMGWHNDWAEQTAAFQLSNDNDNYYIIHGDNELYTSLEDVITRTNPRVLYAVMDDADRITAYFSHEPLIDTNFHVYVNGAKQNNICSIVKEEKRLAIFTNLPQNILPHDLVEIRASNTFLPAKVTMRGFLNRYVYKDSDMGATFIGSLISLRVWAPTAKKVELLLYSTFTCDVKAPEQCFNMTAHTISGTYHVEISREFTNKFYLYRLYFDTLDRNGQSYTKVTYAVDPYANGVGLNGNRGVLVDLDAHELMPEGWIDDDRPPLANKEDAVIYEMHLRDFTIDESSGVKPEWRGKFMGAAQDKLTLRDPRSGISVTAGLDSIAELGITHAHILPFFDFSSVDESRLNDSTNRNWGYDPKNYNAPDGSYSVDPYNPLTRIREARAMVHSFHKKGIRVVMDMVYNHMTDTQNLDKIVPGYYFRSDYLGRLTNGSGCGNELATERPMVSKMIVDSVLHWVKDYHISGLRFDLMELIDINTMKTIEAEILKLDPSILIYGEPWSGGSTPLVNGTHRGSQKNHEFAIFNDFFRDALRGNNNPGNGFINGEQHNPLNARHVMEGLKGSVNGLTTKPRETINYVDAHDNYTLWDHIEKSQNRMLEPGNYRKYLPADIFDSPLVRQNLFGLGIILTAQGIPFFQGGAEILRTKQGDHNSYRSSDEVNAFFWQDKLQFKAVFEYVKGLIKLRRSHPAFRMKDAGMVNSQLNIYPAHGNEKSGVIIAHYKNNANNDKWKDIVVIYNATTIDNYEVNNMLPGNDRGFWCVVVNHEKAGIETIKQVAIGQVPPLKSHSIMVIHS